MTLDTEEPISPWESATIRATLKGALATAAVIVLKVSGGVYDIQLAQELVSYGADLVLSLLSLWWYYRAAQGRINATHVIKQKGDK